MRNEGSGASMMACCGVPAKTLDRAAKLLPLLALPSLRHGDFVTATRRDLPDLVLAGKPVRCRRGMSCDAARRDLPRRR
jgi:hypothetical protein